MAFYRGAGGVVWEITPPDADDPKTRNRAEVFAEAIRKGDLVECEADGSDIGAAPKKATGARKAAGKADPEPTEEV